MGVSSPAPRSSSTSSPAGFVAALPHLAVVIVALVGIIVLAALHVVTGDVAAGVVGVALGGGGTVAAANLTPNG